MGPDVPDLEPVDFDSPPPEAMLPGPGETVSIAPEDINGRGTVEGSERNSHLILKRLYIPIFKSNLYRISRYRIEFFSYWS